MSRKKQKLKIIYEGDPVLRKKAKPVKNFDDKLKELVRDMIKIMNESNGIGLAAPQVGISKRVIVVQPYKEISAIALINPNIKPAGKEISTYQEGCLSVPGGQADIDRPAKVHVKAQTVDGEEIEFEADELLARVLQHEVDHLKGILFIDYLSESQRNSILKQMKEAIKEKPEQQSCNF
jgi:peptide deformylase